MVWYEPILCITTASGEGKPFLVPVRPHNFEKVNTSEVLNKFSGSEGSHILQIAPVRITIH